MIKCMSILVLLHFLLSVDGFRILVVSPIPAKSHGILGEALVNHLANAGHEITYITAFALSKHRPNVRVLLIQGSANLIIDEQPALSIKSKLETSGGNEFINVVPFIILINNITLQDPQVLKLISDENEKFDLVIVEWLYVEMMAGFSALFNCPFIWLSTVEPHPMILQLIDQVHNPAYSVSIASHHVPLLTFSQRVQELGVMVFEKLWKIFYVSGIENDIYNKMFAPEIHKRGYPVPTLEDLKYNASLILSNSHVSLGTATVLPPNLIQIGGYHVNDDVKPLPADLQKLMDKAKDGVIYFSMGSNLKSKQFPEVLRRQLLQVFGELKQTVIWKFEEDLPNRPGNVHIVQWAPQQSILAHNNSVLFITHGGLLSTTETIHYGVPIIGIPVFADQFVNVARAIQKGFAKKVDLSYEMASELRTAIKEVLSNPKYKIKVKELSKIYHDRSVHPSKDLVHWTEHVIKTAGAPHLRPSRFFMPWYQKLYLDLVLVIITIGVTVKYLLRYLFSLLCEKKVSKSKKNN